MPCRPGLVPVMKFDHDTLEMVGRLDAMGASVPARRSAAMRGITPRSVSCSMSGAPTPSRPITATRGFGFALLNRSRRPISVPCSVDALRRAIDDGGELRDRLHGRQIVARHA